MSGGKEIRTPDPLHAMNTCDVSRSAYLSKFSWNYCVLVRRRFLRNLLVLWRCLHGCLHETSHKGS